MGSSPSKNQVFDDTEFTQKVTAQQNQILNDSQAAITGFFASVDDLVSAQGAIAQKEITNQESVNTEEMQKQSQIAAKAGDQSPAANVPDPKDFNVVYKPKADVLVLLNTASVIYQQSSSSKPVILKGLVDIVQSTINDLTGSSGDQGDSAKEAGAQVPSAMKSAISTLFPEATAIKAAVDGVASVAKLLLNSLESNITVSSSIEKKVQFISPGLYCAVYYSTSYFHYEGGGKTLDYSLNCAGMYVVTSAKLIQTVSSLIMYREISDSFKKRLAECDATVDQFIKAQSDSAFLGDMFGFADTDYTDLMSKLQTDVMKSIVTNFWNAYKGKDEATRVAAWNKWIDAGTGVSSKITSTQAAYQSAYEDLKKYYNDFVLNPPIAQH